MSREVMTAFRAKAVTQRDLPREMLERATMGGIVALVATTLAILFANSALAPSYQALWQTELSITAGTLQLSRPLLAWINQGLLTLLFFVMGLELKRQWSAERATIHMLRLPLVAALGGAIVPATFYAGFNLHSSGLRGWTIPLATDAALALALVALLGTHIPVAVRFFFLTIALIDDVIVATVIMLGDVGTIHKGALGAALALLAILLLANEWDIRRGGVYFVGSVLAWLTVFAAQMPTSLLGVVFAWTIPTRHGAPMEHPLHDIRDRATRLLGDGAKMSPATIRPLRATIRTAQPLLHRIQRALLPWAWLVIVPLFGFANGGIPLLSEEGVAGAGRVALGISAALIVGKPIGVVGACWLAVRLGAATLPSDVRWVHLWGVGFLAGCGFTVAFLAAGTTFDGDALLAIAKLNVLRASFVAASIGLIILTCASGGDDQRAAAEAQDSVV